MSENGQIYTAGKNFPLPPTVTAVTNLTSEARPAEGWIWPSVNDSNDAIADHFQLNWFVLSVRAQECIHCLKAWRSPIHSLR